MPVQMSETEELFMLRISYIVLSLGFLACAASAGVPTQINHQGVVSVNGQRFNGSGSFYFAIVDPSTSNRLSTCMME